MNEPIVSGMSPFVARLIRRVETAEAERDAAIRRAETAEADADRLAALVWPYPTTRGYGSTAANALRAHAKAVAERGQP